LAEYLAFQFVNVHASAVPAGRSPALDRLRQEFADARYYQLERPDLLTVMQELLLRSQRDPAIKSIMDPLVYHRRAGIEEMVENGIREGVFRPNLVPAVTAALIVSTVWGSMNVSVGIEVMDRVFQEMERWLVLPSGRKSRSPGSVGTRFAAS